MTQALFTERFVFLDNTKVEALNKRYVPKKNVQFTISMFCLWRNKRNGTYMYQVQ